MSCGISSRFQLLSPSERQVPHALLTRPPLSHPFNLAEALYRGASFDLHVLGTPPAFVLSQDQTLYKLYQHDVSIELIFTELFVIASKTFYTYLPG